LGKNLLQKDTPENYRVDRSGSLAKKLSAVQD